LLFLDPVNTAVVLFIAIFSFTALIYILFHAFTEQCNLFLTSSISQKTFPLSLFLEAPSDVITSSFVNAFSGIIIDSFVACCSKFKAPQNKSY